ncbi:MULTISPECIES: hypothetical protein [unclassified Candidatus Frackibacter]|uniref:hypothetical protein n=1 Tax=unclassified Candidatus Frackibacter TaxID=2648818 RepID=UPI00079CA8EF|nr:MULTISPECIES: hypothetical protein [unclassified Candidatus Frackibacter]KXS41281.1 MAG: hypothetical protein AWU54_1677 [Candidatus Frackibacter sp. T328-2]
MFCIICGKEISDDQFRNTCDNCEREVSKLSQQMVKSRKRINFRQLRKKKQEYSKI